MFCVQIGCSHGVEIGEAAAALIGTSGEQTSVFMSPALIMPERDLHLLLDALDHGLAVADDELDRSASK